MTPLYFLAGARASVMLVVTCLACVLLSSTMGCVSVNIGPKGAEKSDGVRYEPPAEPFQLLNSTRADGAWQNPRNGNSIGFLSTCNDPADPSLESVAREMLADLKDPKTLRTETLTYNGREALDTEVEAKAEGVPTRIRTVVFKKNGCLYALSYVGVARRFDENRGAFDAFMKGFQAP